MMTVRRPFRGAAVLTMAAAAGLVAADGGVFDQIYTNASR
jgi:hypothetical protein